MSLYEKATPRPWIYEDDREGSSMGWIGTPHPDFGYIDAILFDVAGDSGQQQINAEFVIHAVNNIEAQEAEMLRLNAEVERWYDAYTIAFDQAMSNGEALAMARMELITAGCEWQEIAEQKQAVDADNVRLRSALAEMVYETTSLSPMEDDGSHWCKISAAALANARAALSPVLLEDGKIKS